MHYLLLQSICKSVTLRVLLQKVKGVNVNENPDFLFLYAYTNISSSLRTHYVTNLI